LLDSFTRRYPAFHGVTPPSSAFWPYFLYAREVAYAVSFLNANFSICVLLGANSSKTILHRWELANYHFHNVF